MELSVAPFVDDDATPDGGDPALASATGDGTVCNGMNWNVGNMPFMQNLPDDAAWYVNEVRIDSDEGRFGVLSHFQLQ